MTPHVVLRSLALSCFFVPVSSVRGDGADYSKQSMRSGLISTAFMQNRFAVDRSTLYNQITDLLHYSPGFEGWDYSRSGILTDYAIAATCILCFLWIMIKGKGQQGWWNATTQLMCYHALVGLTYGCGGAAHHVINSYASKGEVMGKTWSSANSEWMYFWIASMSLAGVAGGFVLSIALSFSSFPVWTGLPGYLGGVCVGIFEAYSLIADVDNGIKITGVAAAKWGIFTAVLACASIFISMCQHGGASGGRFPLLLGMKLLTNGYAVVCFAPSSCRSVGINREGCPFPEVFNQNAIFHVFVMANVILVTTGVYYQQWSADDKLQA